MKIIARPMYINQLKSVEGTPDIKIITGIRRSGKSVILESFCDYVRQTHPDANIIRVNFNLLEFERLTEYHALNDYVEARYVSGAKNYVAIDEVQMCDGFEKTINSLHASQKYDIYITGSNAFLQSSDLATLFTGRTFEIKVYPFSFAEFCMYYDYNIADSSAFDKNIAFERYIEEGGMPGSYVYNSMQEKYRYINEDVFNALMVRDIVQKQKIRNTSTLGNLIDFLMDNIGNITSIRKITSVLNAHNTKISDKTVAAYVEYLCNTFAFYKIRRYDMRGKRYLSTEGKYYLADQSFRYARLGTKKMDYGRVLENIVAIELLRRNYEIYAGMLYRKEMDFVAMKQSEKIYIQVADDISSEKTFEREIAPLLAISDGYAKYVLARTRHKPTIYEGIKIIDIADWLLGNWG